MIEKRYRTMKGLTIGVQVYSSYDEADAAAGKANATLDQANDNLHYRGTAADAREFVCETLEKVTGIERKTKDSGRKTADGSPVHVFDESELDYAERVCAEKGWKDLTELQPAIDAWAQTAGGTKDAPAPLAVSIKERERKAPTPKKLAAKFLDAAKALLAGNKIDQLNTRLQPIIGKTFTATGDTAKDAEALGWLVKEFGEAMEAKALGGLSA
jgi:hypothetical protein